MGFHPAIKPPIGAPRASVGEGEGESLPEAAAALSLLETGYLTVRDGARKDQVSEVVEHGELSNTHISTLHSILAPSRQLHRSCS